MIDPDDLIREDTAAAFYQKKIRDITDTLGEIALQVEWSTAVADLAQQPGWKKVMDQIRQAEAQEIGRLRSADMNEREFSKRQGRLSVFAMLLNSQPLGEEELAELREKATLLRNQLAEYRNLIS